jgi:ribonuclease R
VYCEPVKEGRRVVGYRLLVAIADVSFYVKDKTPLNEDALTRATSVYFPRRVVPMLPEKLSNGLCSLNPHVDRLCMVCDMVIDLNGQITAFQFYEAVMLSAARLTYNQVWEFLDQGTGILATDFSKINKHIKSLYDLFKVLLDAREVRGAMEFETVETYIVSDENGKIKEILPRTRNDAHRLIEECMLAANVCAAEFIESCERPSLYRNHEGPTPEKLEALRKSLALVGLRMGGSDKPSPKDYAAVMKQVVGRPDAAGLQTLMLRSMQQAVYAPDNLGHFGLAYPAYTHFTSPIRRYPDLLVHRTIKSIIHNQRYTPMTEQIVLLEDTRKKRGWGDEALDAEEKKRIKKAKDTNHAVWEQLGTHASMCERRADEASRDVTNWLKCEYMKQFIGQVMPGKISSITNFGAFVTLDDVYVDGLIHISELGQDYFEFDEASYSLRGRSSGVIYRLQDPIKVQIARVDSDTRRVDFVLVREDGSKGNTRRGKVQPTAESERKRTTPAKPQAVAKEKPVGRSSRQRDKR